MTHPSPSTSTPPTTPPSRPQSQLDPGETKSQKCSGDSRTLSPEALTSDVAFRHSGWHRQRLAVADALASICPDSDRLERFVYCGANAWIAKDQDNPEHVRIVADYCHDRWCRPCAAARGRRIARQVLHRLGRRDARFVTLTIKTDELDLQKCVRKLYTSFQTLRRRGLWKRCVTGGCAFCEIKWHPEARRWHPHLHCIVEGKYIPHRALQADWHDITADSYIVDVRAIENREKVTWYVANYATKSLDPQLYKHADRLVEAMSCLHGRRLCLTFGTWRGLKLTEDGDPITWVAIESLAAVRQRARHGDEAAIMVLASLKGVDPWRPTPTRTQPEKPRAGPTHSPAA